MIFLTRGEKACPIMWKSKKIPRVCDSTNTAETLTPDKTTDDAIYFARIIREIYMGEKSHKQFPVEMYTDSKPLFESIYTRTQIKRDNFEKEAFSLTLNISNSS